MCSNITCWPLKTFMKQVGSPSQKNQGAWSAVAVAITNKDFGLLHMWNATKDQRIICKYMVIWLKYVMPATQCHKPTIWAWFIPAVYGDGDGLWHRVDTLRLINHLYASRIIN